MIKKIQNLIMSETATNVIKIPRNKETHGTMILGDTGAGKTQTGHQIISQARYRNEPGICYDPASEFVQSHYQEGLDTILNPLDERFPNWQISSEIKTPTDVDLVAESFMPTEHIKNEQSRFFNEAAQDVFKLFLAKRWTNEKISKVLGDASAIDKLVEKTIIAHKVDPKAHSQRAGILAVLADVAKALEYVPEPSESKRNFSLTNWVKAQRRSWLFLTSKSAVRKSLRPLQSAMLNILMKRLMSIPQKERKNKAWWFFADELHSLNSLSALPEFMVECRKHGIRYIIGTQNKHQILERYGGEAKTMLAQPYLKIFFRCNETETARWISECIGNEEWVKPKSSASMAIDNRNQTSVNFSNELQIRPVASKEQIMHLEDLEGYWKFSGMVVPFELKPRDWEKSHPDFIPRSIEFKDIWDSEQQPIPQMSAKKNESKQKTLEKDTTTEDKISPSLNDMGNEIDLNF